MEISGADAAVSHSPLIYISMYLTKKTHMLNHRKIIRCEFDHATRQLRNIEIGLDFPDVPKSIVEVIFFVEMRFLVFTWELQNMDCTYFGSTLLDTAGRHSP